MIVAALASIPERRESLLRTVESLLPQVDRVCVYLNGYLKIPDFLDDVRIECATAWRTGDRGDAGKFYWSGEAYDYYLACDDDLVYHSGYAEMMIDAVERHGRSAIVGLGGKILAEDGRIVMKYPALAEIRREHRVHLLLTCATAHHRSTIALSPDSFPVPNMADVWLAVEALDQGVPMYVLAHRRSALVHTSHERTIWGESSRRSGSAMDTAEIQAQTLASRIWPTIARASR